jgi:UDP-N-acetylmuramyl pentapeptide synthase
LPKSSRGHSRCFHGAREAGLFLKQTIQKGDAVLLKASRGMGLEKILEVI